MFFSWYWKISLSQRTYTEKYIIVVTVPINDMVQKPLAFFVGMFGKHSRCSLSERMNSALVDIAGKDLYGQK